MENETNESKIDVRIIVQGLDIAQMVSKAVSNIQLERDYNIIVSSIIPTTEVSIVKKVAKGADIILIGSYGRDETYNILFNELKTDFNNVGLFDYNNIIIEDESIDFNLAQKEILNSIIKSTLSYSLNLINIHTLENKLMKVTHNYNNLLDDYNQVLKENEVFSRENKELLEDIKEIKSEFESFKLRYEDIYSREILEIFDLNELWQETFRQELTSEQQVVIATNKFKPDNIIVGQGYIASQSKQEAIDWLKIIRTALIFVEENKEVNKEKAYEAGVNCSLTGEVSSIENVKMVLRGKKGTLTYVMDGKRIVSDIVLDEKASDIDKDGFGHLVLKSFTQDGKLKGRFVGEMDSAECGYLFEGTFVNVNGGSTSFFFSEE